MIVSLSNFKDVLKKIEAAKYLSLDTETTGLRVHHGDALFSISISCESGDFYFNFQSYDGLEEDLTLPRYLITNLCEAIQCKTVFMANAKFDMHMLANETLSLPEFTAWDILVVDKCIYNQHLRYGLADVAKRNGFEKSDLVDKYKKEHKLYCVKNESRVPMYDKVPFPLISAYAMQDSLITYKIGMKQIEDIKKYENPNRPSFKSLIEDECKITRICYEIERRGILIDEEFIKRASAYEQARSLQAAKRYKEITGHDFVDSNKAHEQAFRDLGLSGGKTAKGNSSFSSEALKSIKHEVAEVILEYRDAHKRVSTYYENFLYFADKEGIIHPNIKQAGADTFRFSITDPALQTLTNEDDGDSSSQLKVRSSFKARPGFKFVSIDYSQQEYRLTADYAGEMSLIEQIKQGVDVHEATAKLMGVDRKKAKTLNFALLYGAGVAKMAAQLGISESEAKNLRDKYFKSLPNITRFANEVKKTAKNRGYIFNWAGRILHFQPYMFEGELRGVNYKAPNHLIQSGGAEVMRKAMIRVHEYLKDKRSKIVLTIHDELNLEMHEEELGLVKYIKQMMIDSYTPKNGLLMAVDSSTGQNMGEL